MNSHIEIQGRRIGPGCPVYIVAEISANHNQNYQHAVDLLTAAKEAGADAVKLQTYTPDTLTLRSDAEFFRIRGGTLWDGKTLYDLYSEAYMPWEWQPKLKALADELGIHLFSTAFDRSAVDFLETIGVPVHKVASFEIVDIPLIEYMVRTGKPLMMSTGMATASEIEDAVEAARRGGGNEIALLKCTSAYPAPPEEMNLRTISHLAETYGVPVGLSDHTLGIAVPVVAVAFGVSIIEKHVTLSRAIPGPDSAFSLVPHELSELVQAVRIAEKSLGEVRYLPGEREAKSRIFRRSLFVIIDMKQGDLFTEETVRSIRPAGGLPPKYLKAVLGRRAARDIARGTPLAWDLIQ